MKRFIESWQVMGLLRVERMLAGDGTEPVKGDIKVVTAREVREDERVSNGNATNTSSRISRNRKRYC